MRLLVSACLLGCACRYDGSSKPCQAALALAKKHELVPVCPEQLGGLPTPRTPSEIRGERVINQQGQDVTDAYRKGAAEALKLCRALNCQGAVLKARSPSCGVKQIYDGSFSGKRIEGAGVFASMLLQNGFRVIDVEDI